MRDTFFIICMLFAFHPVHSQNTDEKQSAWEIQASAGYTWSSSQSNYLSKFNYNWHIEAKKWLNEGPLIHGPKFRFSVFQEKYTNLPYYSLSNNQVIQTTSYSEKDSYKMIQLGWATRYHLPEKALFLEAGLGFNYLLPVKYERIFEDGRGVQRYGRPNNWLFSRSEVSLGLGWALPMGEKSLIIKPEFSYNFTFRHLNLVPSFYNANLVIGLKF